MPWADIIIVLLIAIAAFIGYSAGFLGAMKGFIGSIAGLIAAWFVTPLAQAWLEGVWGLESFLARFLLERAPDSLKELVTSVGETAQSMQELRESLLTLPLPQEVVLYFQRSLVRAPAEATPSPDLMAEVLAREIAATILYAVLFILIWTLISFLVRGFLKMLFVTKDGKTILGLFDGLLGMIVNTAIVVVLLVLFSGLIYPIILMSEADGSLAWLHPYLLDSTLIRWMSVIYQVHMVPYLA